jgi:putative nucleotidyltransferase with HDIG domain
MSASKNTNENASSPVAPKKRILVVDDNDTFLGALQVILTKAGYDVTTCMEANGAEHLLGVQPFDAIISDVHLPGNLTGIDLMKYVRENFNIPVVLMTGFADLVEVKEAERLGASGFLAKPFKQSDLFQILDSFFKAPAPHEEPKNLDGDFCKVNIDDFVSGKDIQADVYIRITEFKYVKIAHEGEDIAIERIRAYKSKDIKHLYLTNDDFRKYVGFNLQLAPIVANHPTVSKEKKLNFLKGTGEIIVENVFLNGVNEERFESAKNFLETTISVISDDSDIFNMLNILNSHGDFLYAHSLGVSLYSSMIARGLEWNSQQTLFKLSMGALLHDIGKKEIDRAILEKSRKDLTTEELALYESHCSRGVEILSQSQGIPEDVLHVVAQHHENCIGTGFPAHISRTKIHPLAKVVSVANEFCKFAIKGPNSPGLPADKAIRQMTIFVEKFDRKALVALMHSFKFVPPPGFENDGQQK